jgi:hypothetical protein
MKMVKNRYNPWTLATWIWMALLAVLVFSTAADYGDSWDEKVRSDSGELKLAYYQNLFSGNVEEALRITPKGDNYPGFHDLTLAALKRISPFSDYLTGNLFSALLGLLGIAGTVRLGRLLGGPETGFWAAILLTLLPAWYGHMFINPKDIPFAMGYVWAVGFIYQWIHSGNRPDSRLVMLCGATIGIAMAARIGGLVLVCYLGLFIAIGWLASLAKALAGSRVKAFCRLLIADLPRLLVVLVIAFAILLFFWPAGQTKPFAGASKTLRNVTQFDWPMPVFFEGAFLAAPDLPAYYIIKMIVLKVPVVTLVLFMTATALYLRKLISLKNTTCKNFQPPLAEGLVLFAVIFPVAYVIIRDSILYNGLRHLLFVLPPLCALAASSIPFLRTQLRTARPALLVPAGIAFAAGLALPLISMLRLHPYQYIYYNELAGGTAKASENYETDYWGTAYKELAEEFYQFLVRTKPTFSKPEVVVNMEHVTYLFSPFLPQETRLPIRVVRSRPDLDDYYAASTNWAADQFYYGDPVVEVRRVGITLAVIMDRRGLGAEERELGYSPESPLE